MARTKRKHPPPAQGETHASSETAEPLPAPRRYGGANQSSTDDDDPDPQDGIEQHIEAVLRAHREVGYHLEALLSAVREDLSQRGAAGQKEEALQKLREPRRYLRLSGSTAKILYAILKLQQKQASLRGDLPDATQPELEKLLAFKYSYVHKKLMELREAGYVVVAASHGNPGRPPGPGKREPLLYEIEVKTAISCRDTAALLLELLHYAKQQHKEGAAGERDEGDLKINRLDFVDSLFYNVPGSLGYKPNNLWGYDKKDLLGPPHPDTAGTPYQGYYKGKLNELADAGEYIERVSADWVRPRMKIALEIPYLLLVRDQKKLEELRWLKFVSDAGEYGEWRASSEAETSTSEDAAPESVPLDK
jgi:hypothetical protein